MNEDYDEEDDEECYCEEDEDNQCCYEMKMEYAEMKYDESKDEALFISSKEEAEEYLKRYPYNYRFVKKWLEKDE